jgi:sterol desaturase/sphingolipid hydroxylase (fatty acid hydroxylase superfamily)
MTNWLLVHQAALQSNLLLGMFGCVAVWESLQPRRSLATPLGPRWFNQLALTALGSLVSRLCLPIAAFSLAVTVQDEGWGLFNRFTMPLWLSCACGVLVIDLATYAEHRMFHAIPMLWRFHQIHHSDLDVDCGTAIRHHPLETLVGEAFRLALIAAVGIPPIAVFLALALGGAAAVFNHANVALPGAADNLLRWLVVTPDMHRIHHSANVEESSRNYANLFPWWDRLFSTYRHDPLLGQGGMALGLADARHACDVTVWKLLVLPLRRVRASPIADFRVSRPKPSP